MSESKDVINTITIEQEVSEEDTTNNHLDFVLRRKLLKSWGHIAKNNQKIYNLPEYHIFDFFIIFFTAINAIINFIIVSIPDGSKQYALYIMGTINLLTLLAISVYNILSNPPKRINQANKIASVHWTKLYTDIMEELSKNRYIPDLTIQMMKFKYEFIMNNSPNISKSKIMRFKKEQLT